MRLLMQQLATSKTNQEGTNFFGRVMRHRNVSVCTVGAFTMYLALRFHITREFVDFPIANWLDNSAWYDMI
jgi:Centromere DNA-binding protein complex CBF3 subunit, domain 2